MPRLIVTLIGDDRAGLVDRLASAIAEHSGNWNRSHLGQLAGKFAGIVEIEVPIESLNALMSALDALGETGLLDLTVERGQDDVEPGGREMALRVMGHDQPGIVREFARAMATRSVNIVELESEITDAPMAGGMLFTAEARVSVPDEIDDAALNAALDEVSRVLAVDIDMMAI